MTDQPKIAPKVNIGLSEDVIEDVVDILKSNLADQYLLYTKTRNFHWNVTGLQFRALHEIFEEQYTALEIAIDETAERIRSYGPKSPGTMKEFLELARLAEVPYEYPSAHDMVRQLADDHETMVRNLREDIDTVDDLDDDGAEDFLTGMLQAHQETAWMLRTFIEGDQV
jgi:starvation-inducible DNA-binding protein